MNKLPSEKDDLSDISMISSLSALKYIYVLNDEPDVQRIHLIVQEL